MAKYPIVLALAGYLYFEETILSSALTQIQNKYLKYKQLIKHNEEIYEQDQYRRLLYESFDPENRLHFLYEKIGKQLGSRTPFEGDFLSSYYDDRVQEIKENGAQIYFAQKGGGKTFDALRIAADWKNKGDPVLYFDKSLYGGNIMESGSKILEKYHLQEVGLLREALQDKENATKRFDIIESIGRIFLMGPGQKSKSNMAMQSKHRNQLLIIFDDADDLINGNTRSNQFLIQLKELMKDDLVKILFLCRENESKNYLKEEFDAGVWRGMSKGSPSLKSKPVVIDYLSYVNDVTGLKSGEVDKFFFYFGVDYYMLRDLKRYLSWYKEKHNEPARNIDEFIEIKVKEYAKDFKEKEIDKSLIRVCKQLEKKPNEENIKEVLDGEDKVKLAPVLGPEGWVSFKYAATAYFLCGKPWNNVQNNLKKNML